MEQASRFRLLGFHNAFDFSTTTVEFLHGLVMTGYLWSPLVASTVPGMMMEFDSYDACTDEQKFIYA